MRRLALVLPLLLALTAPVCAQNEPTFGMEFEFAGVGNRITDFSEMPFENYSRIMRVIVEHYGGNPADIRKIEFQKPTTNLEKFPSGMRDLFRAEWSDPRGRTWLIEPEYVASTGFDGYEVVTPPMDNTEELRTVLEKIRGSGYVREARRSGVHLTLDARSLIKANGDARALANLIIMHENYQPMLRRMFNPVRGGGHENYFARNIGVDHHDILREINALQPNERTKERLESIFNAREAREAALHEADPMDPNSWNKLWKYRDMNLAKALNVNANHNGDAGLVEFRMFDLADPNTHKLEADFYRRMVVKAEEMARNGETVELVRARPTEGADPAVNETPSNTEEARAKAREMIEFVGLDPNEFRDVIDRNVRTREVRSNSEFRGMLEALPGGRMLHNGEAFTYGFELEGRGSGFVNIAVPKNAEVKARWNRMSEEAKRAYYNEVVGENHRSVKTHFEVDTQRHPWLDPYWYVESTGNWEIHSRVMEDVTKIHEAMRTAKTLTGDSGKGFHLHMRDNAPDWELLETRGSEFADFMERAANWVYLKRVERLRTDLSLKSWSNARFSESEVNSIANLNETDRATLRVAEVSRGGYGDSEFIDLEIRGFTKYVDDIETLAKIFARNLKTGEFGTWRHTENPMPSEAWGSVPEGLEMEEHVRRYLKDVEGRALTPENARILEGLQEGWADRAGGDTRAYPTGVATPLLPWGNEASLGEVDRRKARFAQEEYLGWLNRYADRIAGGEFGVDVNLANEKAFVEHLGLTPEEARAVVNYRRGSGGDLTAEEATRAVGLRAAGSNEADMERIGRIDGIDLSTADEAELRNRLGISAAKARNLLAYRSANDVESSLNRAGLTDAMRASIAERSGALDLSDPNVSAEMIKARTGLSIATARAIVDYRTPHEVNTVEDLRAAGLDSEEAREVLERVAEPIDLSNKSAAELVEALGISEAKAKALIEARTANSLRSFNDVIGEAGLTETAKNKLRAGLRTLSRLNSATYEELRATGITENQARKLVTYRDANNVNSEEVLRNVLGREPGSRAFNRIAGFDLNTASLDRMNSLLDYELAERIARYRDANRIGRGSEFARYNSELAAEMLEEAEVIKWDDTDRIEERTRAVDLARAGETELRERLGMSAAAAKKFIAHRDAHRVTDAEALRAAGFTAAEATAAVKNAATLDVENARVVDIMERTGLSRAKAEKLKKLAALNYASATAEELRAAGMSAEAAERVLAFREAFANLGEGINYKEVVRRLRLRVRKWVRESGLADSMLRSLLPRDRAEVEVARSVTGEAEGFSSVRRGAPGEFAPSRVAYGTVGDVFASVREAGLSVNADRMLAARTDAERTNLNTARETLEGLKLKIVETNDILAERAGGEVRISTGLLNEIETQVGERPAGERSFVRNRVLGLILGHETAHAGGMGSEKLADAESIRILARANGLGTVLDVELPIEAAEIRAAVNAFNKPTGASHFDNFLNRLRTLLRYGAPGRRVNDMERVANGEQVDRFARFRRADGTLDWKRMGRDTATREALGTAHFALALFLKELAVVVKTGDRVRIEEFFDGLMTTDFYTHYGMFVIGARAGEVAYVRYLERYIKPRFVNGILKSNLVLAAGLALPEIINGTFTGKAFAISLTSLGLSSAAVKTGISGIKWVIDLKKAKQTGTLARTGLAAGRLAKFGGWFYTAAELAVILYFAEDLDKAITKWVDQREAAKSLAEASETFFAATRDPNATPEGVAEAAKTYHDAWTGYRDFLYTPMYIEEAMFADRLEKAARKAKLAADERAAALERVAAHAALKRSIETRYGSLEGYAEHLTREDEKELREDVEKYADSYNAARERLLVELYDENKRGEGLFDGMGDVEERIMGGGGDGSFFAGLRGDPLANAIRNVSTNRLETYTDEAAVLDATIRALREAGHNDRADALGETRRIVGLLHDADDRLAHGNGVIDVLEGNGTGAATTIEELGNDPRGE